MPLNNMVHLPYGVSICFVLAIKPKYARRNHRNSCDALWCGKWYQAQLWLLDCIFSVLVAKTKYMHLSVSHVTFFGPKKLVFLDPFFAWPLCSRFYTIITYNKFVIYSIRICTRLEKFPENGHDRCPKSRSTKPFCAKTRVARCFAELFGNAIFRMMHAVGIVNRYLFSFLSSRPHVK